MSIKLNCPVCGYQEIEGKTCPNCNTDISLIRTLQELAPVEKRSLTNKIGNLTLTVSLLILIIGITLGAIVTFVITQNRYTPTTLTANSTVVNSPNIVNTPPTKIYTVKTGDNLGVIAEKVCGRASAWKLIAKANSFLEKRNNYFLNIGEKLIIPNCQEKNT